MTMTIADRIEAAGVVGAGGAGFPTHLKARSKAGVVLVNAAECEPLLDKDMAIIRAHADEVIQGTLAMMESVGADKGILGIKRKHAAEVSALRRAARPGIEVFELDDAYPAGDEHVLVYEAIGRVVPAGGYPIHVGAVVSNVETLLNVARALRGIEVTHKFITAAGEVKRPGTYLVPIGASISDLAQAIGISQGAEIILDGPMMGKAFSADADLRDISVSKTTSALIALPRGHWFVMQKRRTLEHNLRIAQSACISCSQCTDFCPRYLLGHPLKPHVIMRIAGYRRPRFPADLDFIPEMKMAGLCSLCGVCDFVCPMNLSPRTMNELIRQSMAKAGIKWQIGNQSPVHPARIGRRIPSSRIIARLGLGRYVLTHGQEGEIMEL